MSRKVYLRDDGDAQFVGIGYDVPHLVLCVEAAITDIIGRTAIVSYHSSASVCSYFGEARIFLYLGTPALVLGKVPVEAVELEGSHHVEHFLYLVGAEEMPSAIQVHASIGKARLVLYLAARELPFEVFCGVVAVDGYRKHLLERLNRIQESVI